jgi:hypothetical protein
MGAFIFSLVAYVIAVDEAVVAWAVTSKTSAVTAPAARSVQQVPTTSAPTTSAPAVVVTLPPATVPPTVTLPAVTTTTNPAATPPVSLMPSYLGPGRLQFMNYPLPSGAPFDLVAYVANEKAGARTSVYCLEVVVSLLERRWINATADADGSRRCRMR